MKAQSMLEYVIVLTAIVAAIILVAGQMNTSVQETVSESAAVVSGAAARVGALAP